MKAWEVTKSNGEVVIVEADSQYINGTSTLMFLSEPDVPPPSEPVTVESGTKGKKKPRPKPSMFNRSVTVRAFNVRVWDDVRRIR